MKQYIRMLTCLFWLVAIGVTSAQSRTVTGNVTDEQGVPLPGATILEQGTANGVTTDFDGNFSVDVAEGASLEVSFVGYETQNQLVGSESNYNFQLASGNLLEEVVVTSLGIKREKQALGYAISEVDESSIEQRAEGDIGRVLSGKASGVQITNQSGISGSGTSIIIRGFNTFSQGNQPLFIVDGVPFSSETNSQDGFVNGNNGSSRFLDLDPNNIENVNVLKGLAAATLYGTQGRNGVILITTKSGSAQAGTKKNEITVNSSYFLNEIASLPEYQNQYGNGFDQSFGWFFSNWGPSFDEEGVAGWGNQNSINGSISGQALSLRTNEALSKLRVSASNKEFLNYQRLKGSPYFESVFKIANLIYFDLDINKKIFLRYNAFSDEIEIGTHSNQQTSEEIVLKNNKIVCSFGGETFYYSAYKNKDGNTQLGYLILLFKSNDVFLFQQKKKVYRAATVPTTSLERAFPPRFTDEINYYLKYKSDKPFFLGNSIKKVVKNLPLDLKRKAKNQSLSLKKIKSNSDLVDFFEGMKKL